MSHRAFRVVPAVVAGHVLLWAVGAAPVLAAPGADRPPTIASVKTPEIVVLPASRKTSVTTSFRITLRVKDPDGVDTVVAGLHAPGRTDGIAVRAKRTGGSARSGTWQATARLGPNAPTGTWKVRAFATDREQRTTDPGRVYATYDVRTPTRVTGFDIGEPVETGQPLKVRGTLQRWAGKGGWEAYADREVALQFRPQRAKSFATIDTARTREDGSVADVKASAQQPGHWRISFAGHEHRAAAVSREDEVSPVAPEPAERETEAARPTSEPTSSPTPRPVETAEPTPVPSAPAPGPSTVPRPATTPSPAAPRSARDRPRQPAGTSSAGGLGIRAGEVSR